MYNHIKHEFPKLIQENLEGERKYVTPTGERYPSVTTVLSVLNTGWLEDWKKVVGEDAANAISRNASIRGTAVHSAMESLLNNEELLYKEMMPNVKSAVIKMKPELNRINNIHCLEQRLFSHNLKIAGTVDCIAEFDGVLSVIDFKTSRKAKRAGNIENYFMQCTAYSKMFHEMVGIEINQIVVMIGVDELNYCQVLVENPNDYIDKLMDCIKKYRSI